MNTPGKFLPKPAVTTYDDGYVTELRPDSRQFIWYPRGERHEVRFVVKPDPRDARIAELEAAIYKLASGAIPVGGNFVEVLKADWREMMKVVLAGTEPEPTATVEEAMAI